MPLEKGVYGVVGNNGCGKSTILLVLAQVISKHYLTILSEDDFSNTSEVKFSIGSETNIWKVDRNRRWVVNTFPRFIKINGMYEGSLFYGTRFNDSKIVDGMLKNGRINIISDISDADDYIKNQLSYILHGDQIHYRNLKKIKNKFIGERLGLRNTPYFISVGNSLISQYRMSSGECLLISLLHFIYNAIVRKSLPVNEKVLVLIDEIELALHPIAVSRLIDLLQDLSEKSNNLVVILTSHSPEVIRKINPYKMYKIENIGGVVRLTNPCFPSYAIRDVYQHDGFDYLLLVEDKLALGIVDKILLKHNLKKSKLLHIVPVGGATNVLTLHLELLKNNILGLGRTIISILDGDVQQEISTKTEFSHLKKLFLPINSVEKLLYEKVFKNPDQEFIKLLNDKYFTVKSINQLLSEHNLKYQQEPKEANKKFYFRIKKDLEERSISEELFMSKLSDDLLQTVNFSSFVSNLQRLIT